MFLNNLFNIIKTIGGNLGNLLLSLRRHRAKKSVIHRIIKVLPGFYVPSNEEWLDERIPVRDVDSGHLLFNRLSKADKTKWILNRSTSYGTEEPNSPIYIKRGTKGY